MVNEEFEFYTAWMNQVFYSAWKLHKVDDLLEDISSGIGLTHLTNALYYQRLPVLNKNPETLREREENVELCLEFLKDEGVPLNGIYARDIAEGNEEIVLSLCCFLKRHFSVQKLWQANVFSTSQIQTNSSLDSPVIKSAHDESRKERRKRPTIPSGRALSDGHVIGAMNAAKQSSRFPETLRDTIRDREKEGVAMVKRDSRKQHEFFVSLYDKEDILLFEWVASVTGFDVVDYESFSDGILLFELVNRICVKKISSKIFFSIPTHARLQLILDTIYFDLNINTPLTATNLLNQSSFIDFINLLASLKHVYDATVAAFETSSRVSFKKVTWDPNTYAKMRSRELYLRDKPSSSSPAASWVRDAKDFIPSLPFDFIEYVDHLEKGDIESDSSSFRVTAETDSAETVNQPLSNPSKTSLIPKRCYHNNSETSLILPSETSYNPPRWSDILKEELQYAVELKRRKAEQSFVESPLSKFDQEIKAVFDNDDTAVETDNQLEPTGRDSTPFFVPRTMSEVLTSRETADINNNPDCRVRKLETNCQQTPGNSNSTSQGTITEDENFRKEGNCQPIAELQHCRQRGSTPIKSSRNIKLQKFTEMIRAQSKSPSGFLVNLA